MDVNKFMRKYDWTSGVNNYQPIAVDLNNKLQILYMKYI